MKIQNKKTETSQTVALNDKDYLNRLLTSLKELIKGYATAMTEASNDYLYNTYLDSFNGYLEMQRKTYEIMFENGWYQLETMDKSKIKTKYNMLQKEFDTLNNSEDGE